MIARRGVAERAHYGSRRAREGLYHRPMTELLRNAWFVVTREPGNLIVMRRSTAPITPRDVEQVAAEFERAVPRDQRGALSLLQDVRDAPFMGDPELERSLVENAERVLGGFARLAIVMRTAVGRLQASRMNRDYGWSGRIFDDETAARAYLMGYGDSDPRYRP